MQESAGAEVWGLTESDVARVRDPMEYLVLFSGPTPLAPPTGLRGTQSHTPKPPP